MTNEIKLFNSIFTLVSLHGLIYSNESSQIPGGGEEQEARTSESEFSLSIGLKHDETAPINHVVLAMGLPVRAPVGSCVLFVPVGKVEWAEKYGKMH
ncbi:uncharacterized protein LAJ45_00496 [Morchella importuna]|uniref:uncharacterized protein n=1 Tax=Morchella importuna TaxID=1174673 RepID=UPI001E8EDDE0|nr:uncharacterized protein LAJ45_00496 [Morchella importuna]KAH8155486.1 hypothetical protein LAJ45_00496 [Morchella importuna]